MDAQTRPAAVPRMLRSALGSAHRAARAQAQRCAAESGVYLAIEHMGPGSAEQREERCTASGTRAEFARAAVAICPSGSFVSSPLCKNISVSAPPKSDLELFASRPTEGRIAIVTDAGWDAVDAAAFCARWDRRAGF